MVVGCDDDVFVRRSTYGGTFANLRVGDVPGAHCEQQIGPRIGPSLTDRLSCFQSESVRRF